MDNVAAGGSILILGVGNVLLGDEGIGVHVAWRLATLPLPPGVEVVDGGTLGFGLAGLLEGRKLVVLVDAIAADAPPGSIFRVSPGDAALRWRNPRSAHGEGIELLLCHTDGLDPRPGIVILGIVPECTDNFGMALSPTLTSRMDAIVDAVMKEIARALPAATLERAGVTSTEQSA